MKIYAVVDAGNAPGLLEMIKTLNPPASCLYNLPLQEGMAERAPYLIELVSDEVKAWLAKQTKAWGLYLVTESDTDFLKLRSHLRKYTFAMIPISEKPVFFRFYDPRVFWKVTDAIDDWQLHAFLGPIEIVATYYDEQYKQDHFEERRKQFPKQIKMKAMYLTLTEEQFERINGTYEEEYIQELADHMWSFVDPSFYAEEAINLIQAHKEMLLYQRDVKGVPITHLNDIALIHEGEPFFMPSSNPFLWVRIAPDSLIPLDNVISQKLIDLGRGQIEESAFHHLTNSIYKNYLLELVGREEAIQKDGKSTEEMPLTKEVFRAQIDQFAKDFYHFCSEQKILNNRTLKGLTEIFIKNSFFSFKDIPTSWLSILYERDGASGEERGYRLFVKIIELMGENR